MEAVDAVIERFRSRGIIAGAEFYLPIPDGYDFVAALREARGIVLGIEAVRVEGGSIYPLVDQIADFSVLLGGELPDPVNVSSDAAAAFLDQLPTDDAIRVTFTVQSSLESLQ